MSINNVLYGANNPSLEFEKEMNTEFIIKEEILEENVTFEHKVIKNEIIDEDVTQEHIRIKDEIVDESFTAEHVQIKEEKLDEYIPIEPEPDLRYEQFSNITNRNITIGNTPADQQIHKTPFPQDTWYQIITNPSYLNKRERTSSKSKRYICDVCNKSFGKRMILDKHLRKHKTLKKFSCDVCHKIFTREGSLSKHKIVHEDIERKPFACEVCNKKFAYETCLITHKRTHINDKFKKTILDLKEKIETTEINGRTLRKSLFCGVCNEKFERSINLIEHKCIHKNEIHFSCNACSRTFNNLNGLNKHKRIHTF